MARSLVVTVAAVVRMDILVHCANSNRSGIPLDSRFPASDCMAANIPPGPARQCACHEISRGKIIDFEFAASYHGNCLESGRFYASLGSLN